MARMVLSLLAVMALAGLADASSELAAVTAGWPAPGGIGTMRAGVPFPLQATISLPAAQAGARYQLAVLTRDASGTPCRTVFPVPPYLLGGRHTVPLVARHQGNWLQPLRVALEREDGAVLDTIDVPLNSTRTLAAHQPVVLTLGSVLPELDRVLGRIDRPLAAGATESQDLRTVEPYAGMIPLEQVGTLPVEPLAYSGVDLVVVSLTDAFMEDWMRPEHSAQRRALGCWLVDGGRLVVSADPRTARHLAPFGASLDGHEGTQWLPAVASATQEERRTPVASLPRWVAGNLPPLSARPIAHLELRKGQGETLAREPSPGRAPRPVLVQGGVGRGWAMVVAITLEPKDEVARQEKEIWQGFWRKVLADAGVPIPRAAGSAFIDNLADTGVPVVPFGWTVILIILLAVLVGPLDYLFTSRLLGRPSATWFTFPLTAVAATSTIFAASWFLRGNQPVDRYFALVDIDTRQVGAGPRAWGEILLARVDPTGSRHDISLASVPGWLDATDWRVGPVGPLTVEDRLRPVAPWPTRAISEQASDLSTIRGLLCPPGGEQLLGGRFSARLATSPIKSLLQPSRTASHLFGTLENHWPEDLTDVVLLYGGRQLALGDLPGRGGRLRVETIRLGDAGESSETWRLLMHQGAGLVEGGRVMGGREQARPNLPSAFQPFLFARPEASDAVRAMGSGWDQSWRLRKLEDIWRDEVVLIGRMGRAPADILLDGIPATDNPSRGAVLVRVLLPVVRSVELPE